MGRDDARHRVGHDGRVDRGSTASENGDPATRVGGDSADRADTNPANRVHTDLASRVHTDLPRVRPEDMVTTHDVDAPPDPRGGRDTDREFMLRHAGGI